MATCLAVLFIGSVLLTAAGCGGEDAAAGPGAGGRGPSLVRVGPIVEREVTPTVTVVGSVVPVRTSIVASGADGVVQKFHVEEGDFVEAAAELSELRMVTTDLGIREARSVLEERKRRWEELAAGYRQEDKDEAEARMKSAEASMENAAKKLERAKMLIQRGAIGQDEFDDAQEQAEASRQAFLAAQATYERMEAGPRQEEVDQARARYDAQAAQVDYLEAEKLKRYTLAPFDGFVVEEHTYRGQWLSKGDPVVTLARMDRVDVVANVDQQDESLIRLNDQAKVRINGIRDRDWSGPIVAVVPRSEWRSGSRGFPVKVRLKNRSVETKYTDDEGREHVKTLPLLKEGMMAEVTFSGQPITAVLVPKNALVRTSRGTQMFLFDPQVEPKWSVRGGDKVLGTVVAADEAAAIAQGRSQFDAAGEGKLSVEQAAQPRWEVVQPGGAEAEPAHIGYVEADNEQLAIEAARKQFKLPTGAPIQAVPQVGTVRRVVVELGISDGEMVQILGKAARPGAFVVTEGAERLHDYQEVQIPRRKEAP